MSPPGGPSGSDVLGGVLGLAGLVATSILIVRAWRRRRRVLGKKR
jgi:hypothetical protein